jgi:hypothetical protein
MMRSVALAPSAAPNQAFIYLNRIFASYAVPVWPDHSGPKLVEDLEGGFIAGETQLPLKLKSGLARRLGCDQISTPEPD